MQQELHENGSSRVADARAAKPQLQVQVLLLDTAFGREGVSALGMGPRTLEKTTCPPWLPTALGVGRLHICDVPSSWAECACIRLCAQVLTPVRAHVNVRSGTSRLLVALFASVMLNPGHDQRLAT